MRAAKTSAEFAVAIGGLKETLKRLEAEQAEAETRRDNAVLDGGDLPALRQRVTDIQTEVATIGATISIAEKRREEAAKREEEHDIQDIHAEAVRLAADLGEAFKTFDAKLLETREAACRCRSAAHEAEQRERPPGGSRQACVAHQGGGGAGRA